MNKKAFTLIELIGVIVILGLLLIVTFTSVLSSLNKGKLSISASTKQLLISNAKSYVTDNLNNFITRPETTYCIGVNTLVDEGYTILPLPDIEEDVIKDSVIKMYYGGEEFEYTVVHKNDCEEIINPLDAPTFIVSPTIYSQSKTVTINYPSGYTNEYSLDSGVTWQLYEEPLEITQNITIMARITSADIYMGGNLVNINTIDSILPETSVSITDFEATITITDNVGILAYAITQSAATPETWTTITHNPETYTTTYNAETAGDYYVHVRDVAGNISVTTFKINLPDITWAAVGAEAHENNNYSKTTTYVVPEGYNKLIVNELSAGTYCSGNTTGIIYGITSTGSQVVIYSKTFAAPGNGTITHIPGEFDISDYSSIKFYVSGTSGYYWGGTQFKGMTIKQIN